MTPDKNKSTSELRSAELDSSADLSYSYGGVEDAREAESSFVNSVSGRAAQSFRPSSVKANLKKRGPLLLIGVLFLAVVVLIFLAQSMMPFAVVNRIIEEFNTNGFSSVLRSDNLLDLQLSASDPNIALTDEQISSLEEKGFYVSSGPNGTKSLTYKKRNGKYQTVVSTAVGASASASSQVYSLLPEGAAAEFMSPAVIDVSEAFNDPDFKRAFVTSSKTWRGGVAGWYDQIEKLAESVHGYSRSRWFKYAAKSASEGVEDLFTSLAKSAALNTQNSGESVTIEETKTIETKDANGNTHTETRIDEVPDPEGRSGLTEAEITAKFLHVASTGVSVGCAAVEGFMSVQTLITTYQRLQKINLVSGYMEAVQKVQAGDGDDSPMNEYSNRLVERDANTGKTAINASGMSALFSGTKIDNNDSSVLAVNGEASIKQIGESRDNEIIDLFSDVVSSGQGLLAAYRACNYASGTLAIANAAFNVASLIPVIGQGLKVFQVGFKAAAKALISAVISAAAPIIAQKVIELVGKSLIEDMATEWLGEDLGNAMVSGGNVLLSTNHQTGGGSPASKAKLAQFKALQADIIADEAKYQREFLSPFDPSSQYTFLGSLVYQLIPLANSSGLGSVIKEMGTLVKSSVTDLLPSASAIAETEMVGLADPDTCPTLSSIGIQGDPYCNPLYITDTGTINVAGYFNAYYDDSRTVAANGSYGSGASYSPEQIVQIELATGNITESSEGVYTIVPKSELAKYATYCGQRVSSWGIADANIANAISLGSTGVLSMIPIIGDAVAVADAAVKEANLPWTTGSACVASDTNEYWNGSKGKNQIHQRFIEDERWREGVGATTRNPVAVFLENYYEENPLDNSYEGILARYSGMTKEDVIATLDIIKGLNYIANYKPETRLAFGKEENKRLVFESPKNENEVYIAIEPHYVIYSDLRNRTVIV